MVDPKVIPQEHMGSLAGMYVHAGFVYGTELLELSERKQRKVRRWLMEHYGSVIWELPEAVRGCFDPAVGDGEVLRFLAACHERMQQITREQEQERDRLLEALDGETADALRALLEDDMWQPPHLTGSGWELTVGDGFAFRRTLILQGVEGTEFPEANHLEEPLTIRRDGEKYVISGVLCDSDQVLRLCFSSASVRVEQYDPVGAMVYWDDPWDQLGWIAGAILEKGEVLGEEYLAAERPLLPLLKELEVYQITSGGPFPLLAELADRHGQRELAEHLRRTGKLGHRIQGKLCQTCCEPMWREVYDRICQSQAGYPSAVEVRCDPAVLEAVRSRVQKFMMEQGFSGEYPAFWKRGDVPGLHLVMSYDQSYCVFAEKDASFYVRCMETCGDEDSVEVHFLCGTAFRRKRMAEGDLWSCLFNAQGRRLFWWVHDRYLWGKQAPVGSEEQLAAVAVKKVQLRRLTKQERERCQDVSASGWSLFWWFLIFGGGLFAAGMILAMMLMAAVICILFGQPEQIVPMLTELPWAGMLMFAWLGFGGSMGLVEVLALRNK